MSNAVPSSDDHVISTPPEKISTKETQVDPFDNDISHCAQEIWGMELEKQSDRTSFAKFIYHLTPNQIESHPKKDIVLRTRQLIEERLNQRKGNLSDMDTNPDPYDSLFENASGKISGEVEDALWSGASVTVSSHRTPEVSATIGLNLAASSLAFARTLKKGASHCYDKFKIYQLQKKKQAKQASLSQIKEPPTPQSLGLAKEIREIEEGISLLQDRLKNNRKGVVSETFKSSAYFSGSVIGATAATGAAVIASVVVGEILVGGAMVVESVSDLNQNIKKSNALTKLDKSLQSKELELGDQRPIPLVESVLHEVIGLKSEQIREHQKKQIRVNCITSGLMGTTGMMAIAFGFLPLLVKAGVAIGVGAIAGTGFGLAALLGLGLVVGGGVLAYRYYKHRKGLSPEISRLQKSLLEKEKTLSEYRYYLSTTPQHTEDIPVYKGKLREYLRLSQKFEQQKAELVSLKAVHEINSQVNKDVTHVINLIDQLDDPDQLRTLWKSFKEVSGSDFSELDSNVSLVVGKEILKKKICQWLAEEM